MRRSPELVRQFIDLYESNLNIHPVVLGLKDVAYELTETQWIEKHGQRFYKNRMSFATQYHYVKHPQVKKNNYIPIKDRPKEPEDDGRRYQPFTKLWPQFQSYV